MRKHKHSNIKRAISGKIDAATNIALDLKCDKAIEEEISDALTLIRAAITLRENNPNLDRDANLELALQLCRHVANAAEHLPPVDEEGEPYGYEKGGVRYQSLLPSS